MPRQNASSSPNFRKNSKLTKSTRHFTPLLIAGVALVAAVVFSVSVESRSSGWLWKAQPSSPAASGVGAGQVANKSHTHLSPNLNPGPRAASPVASPTVTATKADSLFADADLDGKADPGDTLKYTVVIGATGMDATGVQFTDTVDPNTAFVAGSLRTTPLARPDSYSAAGNIRISVAAPGVLTNDSDPDGVGPAPSVTAGSFASAQGGNVNLSADGSFTYNPPAGFEGNDSFTYTLNDNDTPNNTDTGTVSITVSGMIWFINNGASCPCDGRLTNPFNTLASFQLINDGGNSGLHPAANDNIFVYESATDYVGPVTLLNGQKFIGQDATDTLSNISGVTPPAGSDPLPATNSGNATIVNITSASAGINVGMNNTLRGFTGGNAATDISGSGFGTLNVSDVTLNGTGQALNLTNGTLNATFGSISSTDSATTGISLTTVGGSLSTGSTTITNPTGIGISVNTSSLTLGFANTSVTGSGGSGVSLTTNTGTITFADLDISPDANQRALLATDNTNTITATSGTISNSGNTAVEITRASSTTPLVITFTSVTSSGGTADGIRLSNTSGSFTVIGDGTNTSVGGNSTGGTISAKSGADGSTTSGIGVFLNNVTNITLRRMTINGTNQNFGVRGTSVTGFTMEYSTVSGSNGDNAAFDEGSVYFTNLSGSASLLRDAISGGLEDNVNVSNTSGTLNRITLDTCTIGLNSTSFGNDGVHFESTNSGTVLNSTVQNCTFTGTRGDWYFATTINNGTADDVFANNTLSNAHTNSLSAAVRVVVSANGPTTFNIHDNTMQGSTGSAIFANAAASTAVASGKIENNAIGVAVTLNSGSTAASGIDVESNGGGDMTVLVNNNTIRQYNNSAILIQAGDQMGNPVTFQATVTNNNVSTPGNLGPLATGWNGIHLNNGTVGTDNFTSCVDIKTNSIAGSGAGAISPQNNDLRLRQRQATTVKLPGYGGANNNNAAVQTFESGQNTLTTVNASNTVPTGGGYIGGSACTQPILPSGPSLAAATTNSAAKAQAVVTDAVAKIDDTLFAARAENPDRESGGRLPLQLATADSSTITLDETAAGYGWFFDTTPSDDNQFPVPVQDKERQTTETNIANSLIEQSKPSASSDVRANSGGIAASKPIVQTLSHHAKTTKHDSVTPSSNATVSRSAITTPVVNKIATRSQLNTMQDKKPRGRIVVKPAVAPLAGETVSQSVGTLLSGKTVHIQFQVTVNNPYSGGATVSNQGTVSGSNFTTVLTDDPAVGGANDPTQTPVLLSPNVSVADAQANEPASGSAPMLFTISLSAPAPAAGASVHYSTADQAPGVGHAVAGIDYTAIPDTPLNFAAGEQVKIVTVNILADADAPEPDETFLLNLTNPANAVITDAQAVGTIKQGNAAGTFLISEFRTSGPAGEGDDFVELYNNSDAPLTIAASDASGGYGLFKKGANCSATPILIGTIPNGTVIPARGHYLFVGSAYSLANYGGTGAAAGDQTLSSDIDSDTNIAIFNTASVTNLSSVTRLDAVGFGGNIVANCVLLSEGATVTPPAGSVLEYSYHRDECGKKGNPAIFGPCPTGGFPADTNDNANDFIYADTAGAATPQGQRLGAPGPENSANPLFRNTTITALLLDSNIGAPVAPNRVRDTMATGPNAAAGTLTVRRRFVNNTGAPVTRLRFRIVDISSIAVPGGIADVRALTSSNVVVSGITDSATCLASNGVATTPCTVTVLGTTLEQPPTQAMGGALNSTMSAGTITLATPLAPGASINLQFLLGVQQTGSFKFFFNIEALP